MSPINCYTISHFRRATYNDSEQSSCSSSEEEFAPVKSCAICHTHRQQNPSSTAPNFNNHAQSTGVGPSSYNQVNNPTSGYHGAAGYNTRRRCCWVLHGNDVLRSSDLQYITRWGPVTCSISRANVTWRAVYHAF